MRTPAWPPPPAARGGGGGGAAMRRRRAGLVTLVAFCAAALLLLAARRATAPCRPPARGAFCDAPAGATDLRLRCPGGAAAAADPPLQPHLLALAVGGAQLGAVDALVRRFPADFFAVVLFHYDSLNLSAWDDLPWAGAAVRVVATRQTKWWFAKRFLTPALVGRYQTLWLWDEDIVPSPEFDPLRLVEIMRQFGLAVAQPAVGEGAAQRRARGRLLATCSSRDSPSPARPPPAAHPARRLAGPVSWAATRRQPGETPRTRRCGRSPCAGFVEGAGGARAVDHKHSRAHSVMVPVFDVSVWPCVWDLIPDDLVHGWGLDEALGAACVEGHVLTLARGGGGGGAPLRAADAVAVVDEQWVTHAGLPTLLRGGGRRRGGRLGGGGGARCDDSARAVDARRHAEWAEFARRRNASSAADEDDEEQG